MHLYVERYSHISGGHRTHQPCGGGQQLQRERKSQWYWNSSASCLCFPQSSSNSSLALVLFCVQLKCASTRTIYDSVWAHVIYIYSCRTQIVTHFIYNHFKCSDKWQRTSNLLRMKWRQHNKIQKFHVILHNNNSGWCQMKKYADLFGAENSCMFWYLKMVNGRRLAPHGNVSETERMRETNSEQKIEGSRPDGWRWCWQTVELQ